MQGLSVYMKHHVERHSAVDLAWAVCLGPLGSCLARSWGHASMDRWDHAFMPEWLLE